MPLSTSTSAASALRALALATVSCSAFSQAALEADVTTSRGIVTLELAYAQTPRAVANFITLAEGSRLWVDARGAVNDGPFYDGLAFHHVENTATQKLAETGSRDGSGSDDPGFTVPDEIVPVLVHDPYVVAMAADGPNTGGCRWYFTGDLSMPGRDGRNVVFGKVTSPASRTVIDSILSGSGNTTITGIAIRRTDPAALAFDEHAGVLPQVSAVTGGLSVQPGIAVKLDLAQAATTVLRAHSSTDLSGWTPHFRSFTGIDDPLPPAQATLDTATDLRRFYHFSYTTSPGAGGPSSLAHRTLVTETSHTGRLIYQFDSIGNAGTYINQPDPVNLPGFKFEGTFILRSDLFAPVFEPHFMKLHIQTSGLGGTPNHILRAGFDTVSTSLIAGRQFTDFYAADMSPVFAEPQPALPLQLDRP